jgi:hypothetical protein
VERRRLDNLAEIERLRREQLRDEALERKIRQLSKVENLEDEQIALRRVELCRRTFVGTFGLYFAARL